MNNFAALAKMEPVKAGSIFMSMVLNIIDNFLSKICIRTGLI